MFRISLRSMPEFAESVCGTGKHWVMISSENITGWKNSIFRLDSMLIKLGRAINSCRKESITLHYVRDSGDRNASLPGASNIPQNPVSAFLICVTVRFQRNFLIRPLYSLTWCLKHTMKPLEYWRVCHKCRFVRPDFIQSGGCLCNRKLLRRK